MSDLSAQQLANTATDPGDVIREALYCIENNYHDTRFVGETRDGFIKQALDQAHEQTDELVERLAVAEHDRDEARKALSGITWRYHDDLDEWWLNLHRDGWDIELSVSAHGCGFDASPAVVSVGPTGPEGKEKA